MSWRDTAEVLENVRLNPNPETERHAVRFIDEHYQGFGPKQSRNLLQGLGLSRFEIPIDSRITKWLNEFGFPVIPDGEPRAGNSAFCVDYGVGQRWNERRAGKASGFAHKLAAVRFPERQVVFDEGSKSDLPTGTKSEGQGMLE